jgi:site-specific DNA-cytosine methylase
LRDDIDWPKLVLNPKHRWISAGEATADVQELTDDEIRDTVAKEHYRQYWTTTSPGGYGKTTDGKAGIYYGIRLSSSEPSRSLVSGCAEQTMHWNIFRSMSYREWKRLGSFPDDYQAKTDKIGKYMIGMSVPPKMTEQVAKAVIYQWLTVEKFGSVV